MLLLHRGLQSDTVIAASEPQSREVRILKGIAGLARNDELVCFSFYMSLS